MGLICPKNIFQGGSYIMEFASILSIFLILAGIIIIDLVGFALLAAIALLPILVLLAIAAIVVVIILAVVKKKKKKAAVEEPVEAVEETDPVSEPVKDIDE